jgi:hypothetical protein
LNEKRREMRGKMVMLIVVVCQKGMVMFARITDEQKLVKRPPGSCSLQLLGKMVDVRKKSN